MSDIITTSKELKALDSQMSKLFGEDYYGITNRKKDIPKYTFFPIRCHSINKAFGGKGIPEGGVISVAGQKSTGKSALAQLIMADFQAQNKVVAYFEAGEASFDTRIAESLGLDIDKMIYIPGPATAEQILEGMRTVIKSGVVSLVCLDSVSGPSPRIEQEEKTIGEVTMGIVPKLLSTLLKEVAPICRKNKTTLLFINQVRANLGGYGGAEVEPGGNAIPFYATILAKTRRVEILKKGTSEIGIKIELKTNKNKAAPPFTKGTFDILFGDETEPGCIDIYGDVIDIAFDKGIIKGSKAWMEYPAGNKVNGRDKMREYLKSNPDIFNKLKEELNHDTTSPQEDLSDKDYSEED